MTTDCHVNYLVFGALKVRDDKVANLKLYANLILTCCVNFNLIQLIPDSALCGSRGTLRNILELICNEPVEFNLKD